MNQEETLNEKELKAIELKYLGTSYANIALAVGMEHSTIKSWFMGSGRLYKAYLEYSLEQTKERKDGARLVLTANLEKAVRTMGELLDSKDERVRLAAAKEIVNRELQPEDLEKLIEEMREVKIIDMMEAVRRLHEEKEVITNS